MADNVTLSAGTADGAVIATDDDGVAQHQYVKLEFGPDNTQTKVTTSVGLPTDPLDRAARDLGKVDIAMGQVAHDAVATSVDPVLTGGYASAAAPTGVSLDGDAVRSWHLLNGAQCVNLTAAGALLPGDATNGLLVNLGANNDVTVTGTVTVGSHDVTNAGTFVVQENGAALTALQLIDDPVATLGTTTYTETTTKGMIVGAVRRDADTTLVDTTNEIGPLQMDANGRLKVEAFSGETLPVSLSGNQAVNVAQINGVTPLMGAGNTGTGSHRVTIATDQAALTGLAIYTEDAAETAGGNLSMAGSVRRDTPASSAGTTGDNATINTNAEGALWVSPTPTTGGGLSIFRSLDLDETEEDVKTSAGNVYGMWVTNTATATRFIKFYNATAATVVVGTTTPVITIGIPGNTSDDVSGLFSSAHGISFGTAICVAATTGVADADTGAPGANDVIVNIFYK